MKSAIEIKSFIRWSKPAATSPLLTTCALVFLLFFVVVPPCSASLCSACRQMSHTKDLGKCKLCGGMTTSGSFPLCMNCSDRLQECEACRAELPPSTPKLGKQPEGKHTFGRWTCEFRISNSGSRSEGYYAELSYAGKALPKPEKANDYVRTPWGLVYWVGEPVEAFGGHGWMPRPLSSQPLGKRIVPPCPGAALVVKVKVLAPERGEPPAEEWIRRLMKQMQIPHGVGSGEQWYVLSAKPVKIHDTKHFGQAYLAVEDPGDGKPLRLVITGSQPTTVEVSREPGTHQLVPHTIASSVASMDFWFALSVETAQ